MAHRGITVADVPNLFLLLGPNTGLGHNSVVFMIESQIGYVADAIAAADDWARRRWRRPAPRRTGSTRSCRTICPTTVWNTGGCRAGIWTSTASTGRCGRASPGSTGWRPRKFKLSEYTFSGVGQRALLRRDSRATRQTHDVVLPMVVPPQG